MSEIKPNRDPLRYYNEIATSYNEHVNLSPYETYRFQQITKVILRYLPKRSNLYVHDVGSGTGQFTIPYFEKVMPHCKIHASDFSVGMVKVCKKNFPNYEHSVQDVENMTVHSNTFDVVTSRQMLEHVPNPQKALKEMYRVLKPEGVVVLSTPSWFGGIAPLYALKKLTGTMQPIDNWWAPFKLRRYFKRAGFKDIKFTSVCFIPYHTIMPQFLVPVIKVIDTFISMLPFGRYFGRTLVFKARK